MSTPASIPSTRRDSTDASSIPADRTGRVVHDLVAAGLVHPDRRTETRAIVARSLGVDTAQRPGTRGRLVEVAGYLGGALVTAAMGLFLADNWVELGSTGQVTALVVITLLLAGAGALVMITGSGVKAMRTGRDEVRRRLSSALLTGAALAGAVTVGRVVDLGAEDFSSWTWLVGGIALVLLGAVAYRLAPSALVLVALAGGALTAVFSAVEAADATDSAFTGLVVLSLAVVWLGLTEIGVLQERTTARAIGVGMALLGAQFPLLDSTPGLAYALTAAVAVAGFVLYLRVPDWPYLVAGVLGVTLVVPEAVVDWTEGSLGAGGAVLVAGLTLLGASAAGFRVRQEAADD